MQFSARTRIAKNEHAVDRTIILFTQHPQHLCYFSQRSILMALVFYYKNMLEKVMMQRTQQFSAYSLLLKEPS